MDMLRSSRLTSIFDNNHDDKNYHHNQRRHRYDNNNEQHHDDHDIYQQSENYNHISNVSDGHDITRLRSSRSHRTSISSMGVGVKYI